MDYMSPAIKTVAALTRARSRWKAQRVIELLNEGRLSISDWEVKHNPVIGNVLITVDALERASTKEKYEMLMRFYLASCADDSLLKDPDFYQESIQVLSQVSVRELMVLYHLDNHQREYHPGTANEYNPKSYIASQLAMQEEDVLALFFRLQGTGLVVPAPLLGGETKPFTSSLYGKIKDKIMREYHNDC